MSVSRVRHRDQAPVPRGELGPADVDHGPSTGAVHAQGPAAAVARLGAFTTESLAPSGGAGPIERRMATEAQREAWRAADSSPARPSIEDIPTSVPWRAAPGSVADRVAAARHVEVIAGGRYESRRSIAVAPPPEPVTPEEPMAVDPPLPVITRSPETQALLELAAATSRTDTAWEALHAADVARIRADEEYQLAHQQLAGAIAVVTDVLYIIPEPLPDPSVGKRVEPSPVVESGADHAESIPAGEPGRTAAETRRAAAAAGGVRGGPRTSRGCSRRWWRPAATSRPRRRRSRSSGARSSGRCRCSAAGPT